MKKYLRSFSITTILTGIFIGAHAQVPAISYTPYTNIYQMNAAITPLSPANSGGAIPATTYGTVSTFATAATNINNPRGLAFDGAGNIYEADFAGNCIYKISSAGAATKIAGTGTAGESDNTTGTSAKLNGPSGIVYDGSGYLYVTDYTGNKIRKISTTSPYAVTTIAGSGTGAETDGNGLSAAFNNPAGVDYDGVVFLYITDYTGNKIRRVSTTSPYTVNTIAGTGAAGETNNTTGTSAKFNNPAGIVYDGAANLYVSDFTGNTIRKINTSGACPVTTFAGSGTAGSTNGTGTTATFKTPWGVAIDISGNVVVADEGNNLIRTITPGGVVTTLAGTGAQAELDGVTTAAKFYSPYALVADNSGRLFTGDNNGTSSTCRKILLTGYTISPALTAGLSFDGTTGIISGTPTVISAAVVYTITGYNSWGSSATTVSIAVGQRNNWTGNVSNAWATAGNWSLGFVPGQYDNAYIGGASYSGPDPTITSNQAIAIIQFGTANNPPNCTLTINGAMLTVNTSFQAHSGSKVTVAGTGAVNIVPGAEVDIINATYPVTPTTKLIINSTITFTLKSDVTGSATVAEMGTGGSITGNVTVQRYFTGGSTYSGGRWVYRNYRLMSSPVNEGVDGNGRYPCSLNYIAASTIVTDCTSTYGTKTGNPSLYLYNEGYTPSNSTFISGNFIGVTNISNLVASGHITTTDATNASAKVYQGGGYMMYFRGDNVTNLVGAANKTTYPYVAPENVTFTTTGTLNQGTVSVVSWTGYAGLLYTTSNAGNSPVRGFNLVGNPYASTIDWSTFSSTDPLASIYGAYVNPTIYVFNPRTNNYDTYTSTTGAVSGNGSNLIVSGQGFFVQSNNHSSSLTFNESAKITAQLTGNNLLMGKPLAQKAYQSYLRLKLVTDSINYDDMVIGFNSSSSSQYNPAEDAAYLPGFNIIESISGATADHINTSVKWLPYPKNNAAQVLKLNVNTKESGLYTIQRTDFKVIPGIYDVWLIDHYKKDSLDIRRNNTYTFTIDKNDTATYGSNRFSVAVRQNPALTERLLNFTAAKTSHGSQIIWTTENEVNYTNFTVQRSTDSGKTFEVIGSVPSSDQGTYGLLDKNPLNGQNLYRLKQEDINNNITYSAIVPLEYSDLSNTLSKNNVSVYPNPAISSINITVVPGFNSGATLYNIMITNSSGLLVKQATSPQPSWQTGVSGLLPGTYLIKVLDNKNQTLIGNTKFVKL